MKTLACQISDESHEAVQTAAKRAGTTMSKVIQVILDRTFKLEQPDIMAAVNEVSEKR